MIFQAELIQALADIVGAILTFLNPIVSPMGSWMVAWMDMVLPFFPTDSLITYIVLVDPTGIHLITFTNIKQLSVAIHLCPL